MAGAVIARVAVAGVVAATSVLAGGVPVDAVHAVADEEIPIIELPPDDGDGTTNGFQVNEAGQVIGTIDDGWIAVWSPTQVPVVAPESVAVGSGLLAFGDDGTALLATAAETDTITWWNPSTGRLDTVDVPGPAVAGNERGQVVIRGATSTSLRETDGSLVQITDVPPSDVDLSETGWVTFTTDDGITSTAWRWSAATGLETIATDAVAIAVNDAGTVLTRSPNPTGATVSTWAVDGTRTPIASLPADETVDLLRLGPTGAVSAVISGEASPPPDLYRDNRVVAWTSTTGLVTLRRIMDTTPRAYLTVAAPNAHEEVAVGGAATGFVWSPSGERSVAGPIAPTAMSDRGQVTGRTSWVDTISTADIYGFVTPPLRDGPAPEPTTTTAPPTPTTTAAPAAVAPRFTG